MSKLPAAKVVTALEATESSLPPQIQEALGEPVGARGRDYSRSRSATGSASRTS